MSKMPAQRGLGGKREGGRIYRHCLIGPIMLFIWAGQVLREGLAFILCQVPTWKFWLMQFFSEESRARPGLIWKKISLACPKSAEKTF